MNTTTVKQKLVVSKLLLAISLIVFSPSFFAQTNTAQEMEVKRTNFTSFSQPLQTNLDAWHQYNNEASKAHPEFGYLPLNAPCTECVEVLEKRTEVERYFIAINDPSKFYLQKSLGALNYKVNGIWRSIDERISKISNGIYAATHQYDEVGFNINENTTYFKTPLGTVNFNSWKLIGVKNGKKELISLSNWKNYTAGDDGIKITNFFPGIDAEMIVYRGAIKTSFFIRENNFSNYDHIEFTDELSDATQGKFSFQENNLQTKGVGSLIYSGNSGELLQMQTALIYPLGGEKEDYSEAEYLIDGNNVGIVIPMNWIETNLKKFNTLVVDPLVTSSNTLAQVSITGSAYGATCFTNYCAYNLSVPTPANATLTNVYWSFNYIAAGLCWLNEGAVTFTLSSCASPNIPGYYWYCNLTGSGTCTGSNISIFSDINGCLPAPSCTPQNLDFGMRFYRCYSSTAGCSNTCIGANSPWTITIEGQTINYQTPLNPISLSSSTICEGQSITATTNGQYGVPGYDYNWSFDPSGTPSLGNTNSESILFPTAGTINLYSIVTDDCGNQVTQSIPVTVTASPEASANPNPEEICSGDQTSIALSSNVPGSTFNWTVVQTNVSGATNSSGNNINQTLNLTGGSSGSATYTVTPTANGCVGSPMDVIVTINTPEDATFNYSPSSFCSSGSNPAPSITTPGGTFSGIGIVFVNSSTGEIDLSSTPVGNYTVYYTTGGTCPGTFNQAVSITDGPDVNAVSNITQCANTSLNVNFSSSSGGTQFDWTNTNTSIGLGASGSGSIPNFTTTNSTSNPINATVTVTPSIGACVGTPINFTITIDPIPTPTAGTNASYCIGDAMTNLTATASSGGTLNWYTDAGLTTQIGTGTNITPISTLGVTNYYLTETINGCTSIPVIVAITINPLPTISAGSDMTVCEGETIVLAATGGISYSWDNGIINGQGFLPPAGVTNYTVTGTDANNCQSTDVVLITVSESPIATFNATPVQGVVPLNVTFTNQSSGATNYVWDFGNGNGSTSSDITLNELYTSAGTFQVILTASNALGCSSSATTFINVTNFSPLTYVIPNVFTPNGDGDNDTYHFNLENAFSFNGIIHNRWGNVVGKINGTTPMDGWNGLDHTSGNFCSEGVYFINYTIVDLEGNELSGTTFFQIVSSK